METLKTYFDYADNDYKFLADAYNSGIKGNHTCAMAQEICEKYLKDIIDSYIKSSFAVSEREFQYAKDSVMRTHNLNKLLALIIK